MSDSKVPDDMPSDWYAALNSEGRAQVAQARFADHEETKRVRIREHEATRRDLYGRESYFFVRGMFVCFLAIVSLGGTCVGYHAVELRRAQVDLHREQLAAAHRAPAPPVADAGALDAAR